MTKRKLDVFQDTERLEREAEACKAAAVNAMYEQKILKLLDNDLEKWKETLSTLSTTKGTWKLMFIRRDEETNSLKIYAPLYNIPWKFEDFVRGRKSNGVIEIYADKPLKLLPSAEARVRLEAFGLYYIIHPAANETNLCCMTCNSVYMHGSNIWNVHLNLETAKIYDIITDNDKLKEIALEIYEKKQQQFHQHEVIMHQSIAGYEDPINNIRASLQKYKTHFELLFDKSC